jgi:hypothetical protein
VPAHATSIHIRLLFASAILLATESQRATSSLAPLLLDKNPLAAHHRDGTNDLGNYDLDWLAHSAALARAALRAFWPARRRDIEPA